MKSWMVVACVLILAGVVGCISIRANVSGPLECRPDTLRHVVLFKFKEGTTPEQIKVVEDGFRALPGKVPGIRGFEYGQNVSPENLAQGYTHCFVVTFSSDKDRDAYIVHPAHKAFAESLKPCLDQVLVVDFWVKD